MLASREIDSLKPQYMGGGVDFLKVEKNDRELL